jgi:tetratricopeptide (TPR) repeat protein
LSKGIKNNPKSAALHYSYGLHLVRQKKMQKALLMFEKSMNLAHANPQYAYTFVLALDGMAESQQALTKLRELIVHYADKSQLKELGLYLSQKLNNKKAYDWFRAL